MSAIFQRLRLEAHNGIDRIHAQEAKQFSRCQSISITVLGLLLFIAAIHFAVNPLFSSNMKIVGGSVAGALALTILCIAKRKHSEYRITQNMKLWQPVFEGILTNDFPKVCNQVRDKIMKPGMQQVLNPDPALEKVHARDRYVELFNSKYNPPWGIDRFQPDAYAVYEKQLEWGKDACYSAFAAFYGIALLYETRGQDLRFPLFRAKAIKDLFGGNKSDDLDALIAIAEKEDPLPQPPEPENINSN